MTRWSASWTVARLFRWGLSLEDIAGVFDLTVRDVERLVRSVGQPRGR